jgi:hypothetical protein
MFYKIKGLNRHSLDWLWFILIIAMYENLLNLVQQKRLTKRPVQSLG